MPAASNIYSTEDEREPLSAVFGALVDWYSGQWTQTSIVQRSFAMYG